MYENLCEQFGLFEKLGNLEPLDVLRSTTDLVNIPSERLDKFSNGSTTFSISLR